MALTSAEPSIHQPTSTNPAAPSETRDQSLRRSWPSSLGYFDAPVQTNSALPWNWAPFTAFPEVIPVLETTSTNTLTQHSAPAPTTSSESAPVTGATHHTVTTPIIVGIVVVGVIAAISLFIGCAYLRHRDARIKATRPLLPHGSRNPSKEGDPHIVEPYTLLPAPSIFTARFNSKARLEQHYNGPRNQGPEITRSFNTSQRFPTAPLSDAYAPDRRPERPDIGLLSAQVATLQHQVLRIQIQNNPPHYASSRSIIDPPDYISAFTTRNVEGRRL